MDLFFAAATVLAVSFISNVSPFFGASYTLLATIQLSLLGPTPFNFVVIVLVSAIGATAAKVAIYYGAFGLKGTIGKNKNIQLIGRKSGSTQFYLVLFVTALMPILPLDDFIYIGAGAAAASVGAMTAVTLMAKVLKSAFEVAVELSLLVDVKDYLGFDRIETTILLSAVFLLLGIVIYKLDWEKTYRKVMGRLWKPHQMAVDTQ